MSNSIIIKKKISSFNKSISVSGDKSLSIRWVLFAALAKGVSKANNLLISEDVLAAIKAIKKLGSYITQFKMILSPSTGAYKGLGGFGAIGSLFPATWNWEVFWNLTAFLSLMLAFMNILPIPALDGGHVVFLIYEMIIGKPAPEKVMEYAQMIGMILLLGLLVFANGNDILRLF